MCGIIGFIDKKNKFSLEEREKICVKMLQKIKYRGRDSRGIYSNKNITIGHNRLAIIDTSKKAIQPFFNGNRTLVMSYNGEIFNHLSLRKIIKNKKYRSLSDTETLMRVYEELKDESFGLMRGMFAVSMYDNINNIVKLTVDQFGIKPLYYMNTPDWFAWSSESKVFSLLPNVKLSINKNSLFEYGIFRNTIGPETIFKEVKKVLPGEIIIYRISQNISESVLYGKKDSLTKNIENLLYTSVSEHLLSDVPVGLQLSGGIDSSLIGFIASKQLRARDTHSFSIGLSDMKWNEFKYSRLVSKLIKTKHHEIIFTQREFCKLLPLATYHLDEPVSYPNTVPLMILAKRARKHVKVLLSGEGADEVFGGYLRYSELIKHGLNFNKLLLSNSFCLPEQLKKVIYCSRQDLRERRSLVKKIINKRSSVYRLSIYDIKTFLPSLLLRQDKMGMASNLENRFPFLDFRLVKYAMRLPDTDKITISRTKILLKKIASKYLPKEIVYRKKCGFGLPISDWLRNPNGFGKYLNVLTSPKIKRDFFNYKEISKLIREHRLGKKNHSEILWVLINLEIWVRVFLDKENPRNIWYNL